MFAVCRLGRNPKCSMFLAPPWQLNAMPRPVGHARGFRLTSTLPVRFLWDTPFRTSSSRGQPLGSAPPTPSEAPGFGAFACCLVVVLLSPPPGHSGHSDVVLALEGRRRVRSAGLDVGAISNLPPEPAVPCWGDIHGG